jgi:hypothetical protein
MPPPRADVLGQAQMSSPATHRVDSSGRLVDSTNAIGLTIIAILIAGFLYPQVSIPLLATFIRLGIAVGGLYLVFRYPWDAISIVLSFGSLGGLILLIAKVMSSSGFLSALLSL